MTTKEKLIFCKNHGISISYIASKVNMVPASLTKMLIETTLQNFAKEIWDNVGELNDRNL